MASRSRAKGTAKEAAPKEVFDAGRFGRWLRLLLVAFYNDDEAAVADLLLRRQAMLKDTQLAKDLRLPERQVRQLLESRLLPDSIVDKKSEGTGERVSSFYRISPIAVPIAARRLRALEASLTSKDEEEFRCTSCSKRVDALKAMSMSFTCCGKALSSTAEEQLAKTDRLKRFRKQCQELLRLTQELETLPGPHFSIVKAVRKPKAKAKTAAKPTVPVPSPAVPVPPSPAVPVKATPQSKELAPSAEEALRRVEAGALRLAIAPKERFQMLKEEDPHVLVQGRPYLLSVVLRDDELQEQMTDEEYQSFYDTDRHLQRKRQKRLLSSGPPSGIAEAKKG